MGLGSEGYLDTKLIGHLARANYRDAFPDVHEQWREANAEARAERNRFERENLTDRADEILETMEEMRSQTLDALSDHPWVLLAVGRARYDFEHERWGWRTNRRGPIGLGLGRALNPRLLTTTRAPARRWTVSLSAWRGSRHATRLRWRRTSGTAVP